VDALARAFAHSLAVEVDGDSVGFVVGRALLLNALVRGQRGPRVVHVAQRETALLQARFGVVPELVHDYVLKGEYSLSTQMINTEQK